MARTTEQQLQDIIDLLEKAKLLHKSFDQSWVDEAGDAELMLVTLLEEYDEEDDTVVLCGKEG